MKHAILSLLVMSSTAVTTVAVAQEGSGSGPPHSPIIIGPVWTPLPTTTSPKQPSPSPPKLGLASTTQ